MKLKRPKGNLKPHPTRRFKIFEHTADMGLRAYGENLPRLFVNAAQGMFFLIASERARKKTPSCTRKIVCEGPDVETLLVFWLSELLYQYSTKGILFQDFEIKELSAMRLTATCSGVSWRGAPKREIKAVTFHQIQVTQNKKGNWRATVIFDV